MFDDLVVAARQRFFTQYPEPNGHVVVKENRRSKRTPVYCMSCESTFEKDTRYRFRVETQVHKRRWTANGVNTFYLCGGCYTTIMGVMVGGI